MLSKLSQKLITILNITLVTNLVIITIGFSYWISLQSFATAQKPTPEISFKSENSRVPSIGSGVIERANSNTVLKLSQSDFKDTSCSNPDLLSPSKTIPTDLKLSQGGLYGASKDELVFKGAYQNTVFYGQNNLNQDLINYIICVMDITVNETAVKMQLNLDTDNHSYLKRASRVIIYDDLEEYSKYYNQAYGSKLGDVAPWGLFETDTISTFLRLDDDHNSTVAAETKDIKYRLTYNIAHEYFHRIFSVYRSNYTPFIEEGMAVFISGKVTEKALGYNMSCAFRLSQSNLANQKTVDLDTFVVADDSEDWYKSNNISELYAVGYYFIQYLDSQNDLAAFTKSFVNNPKTNSFEILKFRPQFKTELVKMVSYDQYDCNY